MNILLIGKTGQLGVSLLHENSSHQIHAPDRSELDIESRKSCERSFAEFRPDLVINTAAFHNVPQCEVEPRRALEVNCLAVGELAALCRERDVRLVTFSTDYVFGGEKKVPYREDDRTNPLQMYGISKLAGELVVMQTAPKHAMVIRTCGLYGLSGASSKGGNFVDQRVKDAQANSELDMGCDQIVSPTYTGDLAQAVLKLIELPRFQPGIYHLVNEGGCTWFDFTKAIYSMMNLNVTVHPVDRGGKSGDMSRPQYSVLGNTKAHKMGISLPHWRDALQRFIFDQYAINQ